MKFKKVEIQAFRAYNEAKNGTFDFGLPKDSEDISDFVSIYAPNGFGKTSFYDAVEFALTDSIDRFIKNFKLNKDAAKFERQISIKQGGQFFLRNKDASNDLPTRIKLYISNRETPIVKEIPIAKRKGSSDFNLDDIKNEYFKSVILSQDWIDAFLKVDDPSIRYEKFMDFFGDKSIDSYYKNLIELINLNEKRISEITKELSTKEHQLQLDFDGDKDILKKVNDKIIELKSLKEPLNTINELFKESDSVKLSNLISERISDISFEITILGEKIKYVDIVFSGSDNNKGIETYFDSKEKNIELFRKEKENNELLENFKQIEKLKIELNKLEQSQNQLFKTRDFIIDIEKSYSGYLSIQKQITDGQDLINKKRKEKPIINKNIATLQTTILEVKNKIEIFNKENLKQESLIKEFPVLFDKFKLDNKQKTEIENRLNSIEKNLKPLEQTKKELDERIFHIINLLEKVKNNQYQPILESSFAKDKDLIINIIENEKRLVENKEVLNLLNKRIKEQELFNSDIQKFISKGAEIINKNKKNNCPLCNYEYSSFKELSEKVANSTLLSDLSSELFKERNNIETQINETSDHLNNQRKSLLDLINNELNSNNKLLLETKNSIEKLSNDKKNLSSELNIVNSSILGFNSQLQGYSYEEALNKLNQSSEKNKVDLSQEIVNLEKNQGELNELKLELEKNENITNNTDNAIKKLKEDNDFVKIMDFFNHYHPNQSINNGLITISLENCNKEITKNSDSINVVKDSIKSLEEILKNVTPESLHKHSELLTKTKETLSQIIVSFEREIRTNLNLVIESFNKSDLTTQLNQIKDDFLKRKTFLEKKIKEYNLLAELKKNVEPYLKYEQAKKTDTELRARKKKLENIVNKMLLEEKDRVINHLNREINSFFYEDLINDLYRRIDPHPDYKKIKFICDFKEDKPKLNVCLFKDDSSDDPIVPNLYFSTAQLNILSLSIFLAKALNAKDDKDNPIECIFIDDPIQSMDSINILSTIDLLRSLVVNEKKQILLSTHDENFHNLLKKKIPSDLFKSKFIELESFGKVKSEK